MNRHAQSAEELRSDRSASRVLACQRQSTCLQYILHGRVHRGVKSMVAGFAIRPPLSKGPLAGGDGFAALDRGVRFAFGLTMELTPPPTPSPRRAALFSRRRDLVGPAGPQHRLTRRMARAGNSPAPSSFSKSTINTHSLRFPSLQCRSPIRIVSPSAWLMAGKHSRRFRSCATSTASGSSRKSCTSIRISSSS